MVKIIGIGNALVDVLVQLPDDSALQHLGYERGGMWHIGFEQFERLQEWLTTVHTERATGGSAANTIHALSALGASTAYIGNVGLDELGDYFVGMLRHRGITDAVTRSTDIRTGVATTFILPDGERTFATYLGAAPNMDVASVTRMLHDMRPRQGHKVILHVEGYLVQDHDFILPVLEAAKAVGMLVSYDLASWNIVKNDIDFVRHLVDKYVDIVFANEDEAMAFSGTTDAHDALGMLAEMTMMAVVKVGKRGAWGRSGTDEEHVPAAECEKVVDTTAAGDFFAAGFLRGYVSGESLRCCLEMGNIMAVKVIQVLGTKVDDAQLPDALNDVTSKWQP